MTAPEKAAPIPADGPANTVASILAWHHGRPVPIERDREVAAEIVEALADRADRASQEEPVREGAWQTLDTAPALAFDDHETDPVALLLCNSEQDPRIGYVQTRRDGTRRGMVGMAHGIVWTHWAPLPARMRDKP